METFLFWILILVISFFIWMLNLSSKVSNLKNINEELRRAINHLNCRLRKLENSEHKSFNNEQKEEPIQENFVQEQPVQEKSVSEPVMDIQENVSEKMPEEQFIDKDETKNIEYYKEELHKPYVTEYKQNKNNDFEHMFLGNIFNIAGAIAIIIACAIFITIISINISPMARAILSILIGICMIGFGINNKKETLKRFASILTGTGFAVLFITVYCATVISHTFSILVCSILGLIIFIGAYVVADRQKSDALVAIALVGGYLNIFMVAKEINLSMLFTYLIFLNVISLVFVSKNTDKTIINYVNLMLALLFGIPFLMIQSTELTPFLVIYPFILWLAYTIYDVFNRLKKDDYDKTGFLNWINYAMLTIFSIQIFEYDFMYSGMFQFILIIAFCILSCIFMIKTTDRFKVYLRLMLFSIFITILFTTGGVIRIALLSVGAMILSYISSTYQRQYIAKWSVGYLCSAILTIFILNKDMYFIADAANYHPIFNIRTLCFAFPIIASIVCCKILEKMQDINCNKFASFLKFCGISLIYIFVCFEINDYFVTANGSNESIITVRAMTYTILGSIYALQMNKLGEITNNIYYKSVSILIYSLTLIFLLIFGFEFLPKENYIPIVNIRSIAYIVAIGASYLLGKWNKSDIYKYISVILGFILISFETVDFGRSTDANINYLMSLLWIAYVGIITTIGIFKDIKYLKNSGIWITILTILKVVFVDIAHVNLLLKMLIYIILGIVLMIVSYYYNKKQK